MWIPMIRLSGFQSSKHFNPLNHLTNPPEPSCQALWDHFQPLGYIRRTKISLGILQ